MKTLVFFHAQAHWQLRNPHVIKELRYLLVRVFGNGYKLLCLIS